MNFCPKCGTKINSKQKVCPNCGYKLINDDTKPHFGPSSVSNSNDDSNDSSSDSSEIPHFGPSTNAHDKSSSSIDSSKSSNSSDDIPKFGAHKKVNNNSPWYKKPIEILKLQGSKFWIKNYTFSFLMLLFTFAKDSMGSLPMSQSALVFAWINFILYPFAMTAFVELGRSLNWDTHFYTTYVAGELPEHTNIFTWIFKFIMFSIRWSISFIVGTIGFIFMLTQAHKIND